MAFTLYILIILGKMFPNKIGKYTHFWIGPKPKEGLLAKIYHLKWAKACFICLVILIAIFVIGITVLLKIKFDFDKNLLVAAIFFFLMPILIIIALVRLIGNLIKAYIYKDRIMTSKCIIFVPIINADSDKAQPVEAEYIDGNIYKINSENISEENERWKFATGDYVRCIKTTFENKIKDLLAVERIDIKRISKKEDLNDLVAIIYAEICKSSANLKEIKNKLEVLLSFLCTPDGRTDKNCNLVSKYFLLKNDWPVNIKHLPEELYDILFDFVTLGDSIKRPNTASNFESLPEQLLERVRRLKVQQF